MGIYCYKYPRPAVTADCAVFSLSGRELKVLLIERGGEPFRGCWAFPGGFMEMEETAEECACRELQEETGISPIAIRPVGTFSAINRDPRGRTLSIVYYTIIESSRFFPVAGDDAARLDWFSLQEIPPLAFDHDEILRAAVQKLKEDVYLDKNGKLAERFKIPSTVWQNLIGKLENG